MLCHPALVFHICTRGQAYLSIASRKHFVVEGYSIALIHSNLHATYRATRRISAGVTSARHEIAARLR